MNTKIEGKFYALTPEVAKKLRSAKLTAAEWRLWSYLIELDPFGDRYLDLPDTITIMEEVGIKKTTFYTAIAKFQKLGLFDFQDKGFAFRNLARFPKNRQAVRETGNDSEFSETIPNFRKPVREIGKDFENSENQSPETAPSNDHSPPQTIQTYSDFIHTLSEGERESFWKFGRQKAAQLPKPPELPMKWIEANWEELYAQFKSTSVGVTASVIDKDWTQHPEWNDWLAIMRESVPRFVGQGTWFDYKTRRAIADWALERNLVGNMRE